MKRSHSVSDQKTRLRSGGRWILLVLAVFGFAGCDDFVMYEPFQAPEAPGPLAIEPTAALVKAKQAKEFSASGGSGDYAFELFAGSGTIGSSTGIYQAPNDATEATIEVTDAAGVSTQALVFVTVPPELFLNRTSVTLELDDDFQFEASGGVPPYDYAIEEESEDIGTIDAADGLFVATSDLGGETEVPGSVKVTDDVGDEAVATVTVTEESPADPPDVWLEPEGTVRVPENEDKVFRVYGGSGSYGFSYAPETAGSSFEETSDRVVYKGDTAAVGAVIDITVTDSEDVSDSATAAVQIVLATPTNLVADGSFGGPKEIRLTWSDNSNGEDGYRIERTGGSDGPFQVDLDPNTTSY
ncbi:MAG: hypothetical protein R6W94_04135, partial [Spirochaetia bacterium]